MPRHTDWTPIYHQGRIAFIRGKPITACPYGDGTNRETWLVGFMVEARRASAP